MSPAHCRLVIFLLSLYVDGIFGNQARACPPDQCTLPLCHCPSENPPRTLQRKETPQFIIASFDDGLTQEIYEYCTQIFHENLLNPDMTNLRATFFVSGDLPAIDYRSIKKLYDYGHEIGSHSVTHKEPPAWWETALDVELKDEFVGMREKLAFELGINETEIKGARVPFLNANGDEYFKMLKENQFTYDTSLVAMADKIYWPYTLDYGYAPGGCVITVACSNRSYEGLWEMPVVQLESLTGETCAMFDDCSHPNDEFLFESIEKIERYLSRNFNKRYDGLRAPLGLHLHGRWLETSHQREAFRDFIKKVNRHPDVWIVTINDLLEWMKDPKSVRELKNQVPGYWNYTLGHDTMYGGTTAKASGILNPALLVTLFTLVSYAFYN